jgi:hypothetical protein
MLAKLGDVNVEHPPRVLVAADPFTSGAVDVAEAANCR